MNWDDLDSGGIELGLESRVAPYYGEAILTQARQVLETLGVKNAKVSIHDEGALPYVIAARIETAVRRAGLGAKQKALPDKAAAPEHSAKDRLPSPFDFEQGYREGQDRRRRTRQDRPQRP